MWSPGVVGADCGSRSRFLGGARTGTWFVGWGSLWWANGGTAALVSWVHPDRLPAPTGYGPSSDTLHGSLWSPWWGGGVAGMLSEPLLGHQGDP